MKTQVDRARDQALRETWDLLNAISYRIKPRALDLESWVEKLDHIRMNLAEAAREARKAESDAG